MHLLHAVNAFKAPQAIAYILSKPSIHMHALELLLRAVFNSNLGRSTADMTSAAMHPQAARRLINLCILINAFTAATTALAAAKEGPESTLSAVATSESRQPPFSWVGQLANGCVGFLVGPCHVITVAHCAYDPRRDLWYPGLEFFPGRWATAGPAQMGPFGPAGVQKWIFCPAPYQGPSPSCPAVVVCGDTAVKSLCALSIDLLDKFRMICSVLEGARTVLNPTQPHNRLNTHAHSQKRTSRWQRLESTR